ncbi:terpene synthase family protein [Streptomyces sp. M10(2022)]
MSPSLRGRLVHHWSSYFSSQLTEAIDRSTGYEYCDLEKYFDLRAATTCAFGQNDLAEKWGGTEVPAVVWHHPALKRMRQLGPIWSPSGTTRFPPRTRTSVGCTTRFTSSSAVARAAARRRWATPPESRSRRSISWWNWRKWIFPVCCVTWTGRSASRSRVCGHHP